MYLIKFLLNIYTYVFSTELTNSTFTNLQIKTKYLLGTYDTLIDIYVEFHGDSRSASNSTCLQLNMQSLCD